MSERSTENDVKSTCPHVTIPRSCFTCRTGRFAEPKPVSPPAEPSCEDWPECALDDDQCAAVAVMGRGRCPRLSSDERGE